MAMIDTPIGKYDPLPLFQEYDSIFWRRSFQNPVLSRTTFEIVLGQVLKPFVRIPKGSGYLDSRIHCVYQQSQGSGKSEAGSFVKDLCDEHKLGLRFKIQDDFTDAALIGGVRENGHGKRKTVEVVEGALEVADILYFDEGESLFNPSDAHASKAITYFNKAMNPIGRNRIERDTKSEGNRFIYPTCSIYGNANFSDDPLDLVAQGGTLPRSLFYTRRLSSVERAAMDNQDIDNLYIYTPDRDDLRRLADGLIAVKRYAEDLAKGSGGICYMRGEESARIATRQAREIMAKHVEHCTLEVTEVMEAFIARMKLQLNIIAAHYHLCRGEDAVTREGVAYAFDFVFPIFQQASGLFDETLKRHRTAKLMQLLMDAKERYYGMCESYKSKKSFDGFVPKRDLLRMLEEKWRVGSTTTRDRYNAMSSFFEEKSYEGGIKYCRYRGE